MVKDKQPKIKSSFHEPLKTALIHIKQIKIKIKNTCQNKPTAQHNCINVK
jgi:hypothetical protein